MAGGTRSCVPGTAAALAFAAGLCGMGGCAGAPVAPPVTPPAAAAPARTSGDAETRTLRPSPAALFIEGDSCSLTGPLVVSAQGTEEDVVVEQGAVVEVVRGGRFVEVRAPEVSGLVESAALNDVCPVARERCVVVAPLAVAGTGKDAEQRFVIERGGALVVLRRERTAALVRIGQLEGRVGLAALSASCPALVFNPP